MALLSEKQLPAARLGHVLRAGESLADAARRMQVSVEALRYMNQLAPSAKGYPGQRLVARRHYVVAAWDKRTGTPRSFSQYAP